MSRKSRNKQIEPETKLKVEDQSELINLRKALSIFNMENPERALQMKDLEIIKLYASKHIPELLANQETWNDILGKF